MGQKKLIKFAAIKAYENVLEFPQDMQGKWAAFFATLKIICFAFFAPEVAFSIF